MPTFSVKPIRLLLQILTADAFIGERDKTTNGQAIDLKRQGNCGRLQIVTANGSCVWRLAKGMVSAILELWEKLDTAKRTVTTQTDYFDSELDSLAEAIHNAPNQFHRSLLWTNICPIRVEMFP